MAVQHRVDVGTRLVDFGMDETLRVDRTVALVDRLAVEIELHDVGLADAARRERGRHQEPVLARGMADADVAEAVDDALAVENAIGSDEIVNGGAEIGWRLRPRAAAKRRQHDQGEASECPAKAADGTAHDRLRFQSKGGRALRYRRSPEHT